MYLSPTSRVAILLHQGLQGPAGKTGLAFLRYGRQSVVAVIDQDTVGQSLSALTGIQRTIPIVGTVEEALKFQPTVLMIGIAPSGGALPPAWQLEIKQALSAGLSIVNGLHTALSSDYQADLKSDQWIWDIRQEPQGLSVGKAQARSLTCLRVLTVGTDMSVGKMSTSLELHAASLKQGLRSKFLATGQTGIMIAGDGIPLDAVRVDYASGAIEHLLMQHGPSHDILHIEGQGSLLHPSSTATLPLMRGSQPTHMILVHRAGQTHIQSLSDFAIPPLPDVIQLYHSVARGAGTFDSTSMVGIALNTRHLDESAALQAITQVETDTQLPCTDPIRFGADSLLAAILGTD